MDFNDTPAEAAFRAEARAWLEKNAKPRTSLTPTISGEDLTPEIVKQSQAWQKKKAEAGWACITWPKEYGGRGASPIQNAIWGQEQAKFETPPDVFSIGIGLLIGLVSGFFKWVDAVMMRVMDGLMAIPSILLAIAVVSLSGASLMTVLVAITIPEIPRVARLVRSVVLSAREEPYVEAAISVGTSLPKIMWRHLMPNTIAPLIVQGTYVCASAVLTEAILSFLGAGINPETPTWGNIMAEGRAYFQIKPSLIFWPGLLLSIAILSVNLIGDAARDALDPRMKQREAGK